MSIQMPSVRQVPSPNYSARSAQIRLLVVHDTEGSYGGAVAWFAQTASQVSAHLVMSEDGSDVTQMVPLGAKGWHVCALNSCSIGIEGAGIEANGFSEAWWRGMAKIVAWLLRSYGLPCRWAQGGLGSGFCSHKDTGAAGGGHSDPAAVGSPAWAAFVGYVKEAYDAFGDGPLPPFALHGLPAPHSVELPPSVTPGPSHGGAARNEPGDVVAHPTASTFPHGSMADIQTRLNETGAQLVVDGIYGNATRNAIAAFQGKNGLVVDGTMGPKTWAALAAVSS